ncbi:MAG: DNA-directed RNA polymerase subunit H [Candidatus Diapherotrites archaeon]
MVLDKVGEHFLVPKHEIVPEDKVGEVLKRYNATPDKLPRILKNDPALEEIGAKKGDVLKITRDSLTAGKAIFFRIVR